MLQYAKRSGRKVFQALFSNQSKDSNSLAVVEVSLDAGLLSVALALYDVLVRIDWSWYQSE